MGLKRPKGETLAEIRARDAARKREFAEKLKNRPSVRGDTDPSSARADAEACAALKRPKGETLAELKARDAERKRELNEKLKNRQPVSTCPRPYSADEDRPDTAGRKRPRETLSDLKKREAERKRELAEKLKSRPSVQAAATGSAEPCKRPTSERRGETLAELQARDRERKKELQALKKVKSKLGTLDYKPREAKPRGETLAELKRKNLEMKKRLKEKVASRTPPHLRAKKREDVAPRPATTGARPRTASQTAQCVRPKTTTGPGSRPRTGKSPTRQFDASVSRAEQDEIIRLRAEIEDLKQMLADVKQEACLMPPGEAPPRPTYMAQQRELTDPTFEGTRYLLETAYKSFGRIEAMCPNFLNDDVKRAAKVLIGLAAGFVPGTPYHSLYKRALKEGRSEPVDSQSMLPEQIVLRPGDVDPNATTIVKVTGSGDVEETCGPSEEHMVKVVQARPSPYSTQQANSLAGIQESVALPTLPEEDEDEMTTELRELLENLRPPADDRGTKELREVVGTIRAPKWEDNREYGLGRPISPLRDFETEEGNIVCMKPQTPESERKRRRHKQAMRERDLEKLERQKKASLIRMRRELWAKAGAVPPGLEEEYEVDEEGRVRVENLMRPVPPPDDNLIDFGPYGEELVQNVVPRSRFARQLGLEGEGQGADLCLGDRY
ncbi:uncharacterized protein LOC106670177 [Cimex lectularius]|uniref:Uncharacterized protein n=1 Tax=Cimex lectularius TaxID=79782 RepID=A0A8I6S0I1_CIMLE|nr:uncharacterized protein LOC106670177 [Cimex lectularius]